VAFDFSALRSFGPDDVQERFERSRLLLLVSVGEFGMLDGDVNAEGKHDFAVLHGGSPEAGAN
jgi:hypothetical protein